MRNGKWELWLDSAKGFAMILVVAGHAPNPSSIITYIYWFHMPAFFIFSGYVVKPVTKWAQLMPFLKKRASSLFIPYLGYLGLFTVIRYVLELMKGNHSWSWYINDIGMLLFGGRFITDYYGVFWFITCLFFTQVVFQINFLFFNKTIVRLLFILLLYTIAHLESWYVYTLNGSNPSLNVWVPWNLDVSLLALFYYSLGYFAKPYLKQIPAILTAVCSLLTVCLMTFQGFDLLDYHLNMKFLLYQNIILDFMIPIIMTFAYCGIIQMIKSEKLLLVFSAINGRCFPIMYLHKAVNDLFKADDNIIYTFAGVAIPIWISIVILEKKYVIRKFSRKIFQFQLGFTRKSGTECNETK